MTEQGFYALYKRRDHDTDAKEIKQRPDDKMFEREIEEIEREYE